MEIHEVNLRIQSDTEEYAAGLLTIQVNTATKKFFRKMLSFLFGKLFVTY